jgi:hypothetical protein
MLPRIGLSLDAGFAPLLLEVAGKRRTERRKRRTDMKKGVKLAAVGALWMAGAGAAYGQNAYRFECYDELGYTELSLPISALYLDTNGSVNVTTTVDQMEGVLSAKHNDSSFSNCELPPTIAPALLNVSILDVTAQISASAQYASVTFSFGAIDFGGGPEGKRAVSASKPLSEEEQRKLDAFLARVPKPAVK